MKFTINTNKNVSKTAETLFKKEDRNYAKNKLGFDLTKNEYSFKEIYSLSQEANLTPTDVVVAMCSPNVAYSKETFEKAILERDIDKVKNTILIGNIILFGNKLYFKSRKYRLLKSDYLSKTLTNKLFELLFDYDEVRLASRLSSKQLFYKNHIISNSYLRYLLGDIYGELLEVEDYAIDAYKYLNEDAKLIVKEDLVANYNKLVEIFKKAKEENTLVDVKEGSFIYKLSDTEYRLCIIDQTYLAFEEEDKEAISSLLSEIK